MPPYSRIHVIINPAAGKDRPILNTLNRVFAESGVTWTISVTTGPGDAATAVQQALDDEVDAVAVYGGDGTVMEVASTMRDSGTPLAILPGGTANVIAAELNIPRALEDAAALLLQPDAVLRGVDMGRVGDRLFFHLGIGLEGEMIRATDRDAKDRSGILAYVAAGLRQLAQPSSSRYRMQLDGETVEEEGVNLMITNIGGVGFAGLRLSHAINISDGLMDVVLIRAIDLPALVNTAAGMLSSGDLSAPLMHWQVREAHIEADPPQSGTLDGEPMEPLAPRTIHAQIVPQAVQVLVPPEAER